MSASPEFYKPAPPAFSQEAVEHQLMWQQQEEDYRCRTPTSGESQVKPPGTCPPALRKPRAPAAPAPCRKRLFEVEVFSLRLEELERLFRRPHPSPPPAPAQKKRRRVACPQPKKSS
ncbi:cyclin-dependent protein kinase inhibitor SMR1-like [Panicum miliaceum]|uniref:Cyclin-dependent protein kinase inhibitor SMR1-like n=1 Tax=Panicum miliaceum TaxID=4540 RepID=A0A3L6SAV7_PANMI|nr:cyclin-dependent protein kinase inhibitor SMR1-like [Panicum miliaceum]